MIKECKCQVKTAALKNCSRCGKWFDHCFCPNREHCDDCIKELTKEGIKYIN